MAPRERASGAVGIHERDVLSIEGGPPHRLGNLTDQTIDQLSGSRTLAYNEEGLALVPPELAG